MGNIKITENYSLREGRNGTQAIYYKDELIEETVNPVLSPEYSEFEELDENIICFKVTFQIGVVYFGVCIGKNVYVFNNAIISIKHKEQNKVLYVTIVLSNHSWEYYIYDIEEEKAYKLALGLDEDKKEDTKGICRSVLKFFG